MTWGTPTRRQRFPFAAEPAFSLRGVDTGPGIVPAPRYMVNSAILRNIALDWAALWGLLCGNLPALVTKLPRGLTGKRQTPARLLRAAISAGT